MPAVNKTKPHLFYTTDKGKNLRLSLEKFARNLGFDPLLPTDWYQIPRADFVSLPVNSEF